MSNPIKKPAKEQVREYMAARVMEHLPPPSQEEIRRRLGWELEEARREAVKQSH